MESSAEQEQEKRAPRRLIAEGWADYESVYLRVRFRKGPSARQYAELRRAFYAGAWRLVVGVSAELAVSANREEAAISLAEGVDAELKSFAASVALGDA